MPTTGAEAPDKTIRLETARLILRPLSLADAPAIERFREMTGRRKAA